METFRLSVFAADKTFYEGDCEMLVFPAVEGQCGVLAHHRNMIAAVVPGTLYYTLPDHQKKMAAVSNGMIKVEDNEVLVLVDSAEHPEDIDAIRAKREADMAQEAILQKESIQDYNIAQANLARAINRLKVKRHYNDSVEKGM